MIVQSPLSVSWSDPPGAPLRDRSPGGDSQLVIDPACADRASRPRARHKKEAGVYICWFYFVCTLSPIVNLFNSLLTCTNVTFPRFLLSQLTAPGRTNPLLLWSACCCTTWWLVITSRWSLAELHVSLCFFTKSCIFVSLVH